MLPPIRVEITKPAAIPQPTGPVRDAAPAANAV